jgi:hypothetical protein
MILACPFCNAKADPAAVQCASCGKTMSRACPACAETVAATATTCKYCGEGLPAMKEPAAAKCGTGIVFLDEKPRKRSCCGAGRTMFWMLVLGLAAFCAYSVVRTRIHVHHHQPAETQQQKDPGPDWH